MSDVEGHERTERPVSIDVDITDGRTVITVVGDRDSAVVVESASGERIYLPPEDFDRPPARNSPYDSPYQSARPDEDASPYRPAPRFRDDSPYQSERRESSYASRAPRRERVGQVPTADGYRIYHPEPVTDVRLLR